MSCGRGKKCACRATSKGTKGKGSGRPTADESAAVAILYPDFVQKGAGRAICLYPKDGQRKCNPSLPNLQVHV